MKYDGPRKMEGIVDWVNKNAVKEAIEVADCAAMEAKTAASNVSMSFFGAPEGDLWETFTKAINNQFTTDKFDFFHTTDEDCASKYGVTAPGIAVSRIFDESPYAYTGAANIREFHFWAKKAAEPSQTYFDLEYAEKIFNNKEPAMVLFSGNPRTTHALQFNLAAKEIGTEIHCLMADFSNATHEKLQLMLRVNDEDGD